MASACARATRRAIPRSSLSMISVSQSGSIATTRPPARVTRIIYASVVSGSSTCISACTRSARHAEKSPSANGNACASPTTTWMIGFSLVRARASATRHSYGRCLPPAPGGRRSARATAAPRPCRTRLSFGAPACNPSASAARRWRSTRSSRAVSRYSTNAVGSPELSTSRKPRAISGSGTARSSPQPARRVKARCEPTLSDLVANVQSARERSESSSPIYVD
jgi:hypothetical protein